MRLQRSAIVRERLGMDTLAPLPLDFDAPSHSYTWQPTGETLAYSTTEILSALKTPQQLAAFARTKHIWEPRGTAVHFALEQFLSGIPMEDLLGGPYDKWIEPLLTHPFWESFEPIAIEYRVCDLRRSIGGSLDFLGFDHLTNRIVLGDLKTTSSKRAPYSTDAQMGSYLASLIDHRKVLIDEAVTVWSSPGDTTIGDSQSPDQCLNAWEIAYYHWCRSQEVI